MRTAVIILTCLALLAGCSAAPEPETTPEAGSVIEFEVFGMDCPGCHGGLENLAMEIPGVRTAKASWIEKKLTLRIESGAQVTDEQVLDAIARANFTSGDRLK